MSISSTNTQYYLPALTGLNNLTQQNVPVSKPLPTEILVKIHAVSLNFRDLIIANGTYATMGMKPNVVPASDMAGEIVAIGSAVKKFEVGQRVCANFMLDLIAGNNTHETDMTSLGGPIDGVLTHYRTFPEHSLVHVPDHLSYEEASTLPCAGLTAYEALYTGRPVHPGDIVLCQGTGGVSIFALQFAVVAGATVIIISSSDEKLQHAKELGAKHLINYNKIPDWEKEVLKITGGRGVDHIIEVGGAKTLTKSLKSVNIGGWVHLIGLVAGSGTQDLSSLPMDILLGSCVVRGLRLGRRIEFENMNRVISAHGLKPVVDKVFEFDQAKEAYEYLQSQKHIGKVVIRVV